MGSLPVGFLTKVDRLSMAIKPLKINGAGEGNRTLVCSLEDCRSTIELRPPARFALETASLQPVKHIARIGLVNAPCKAPGGSWLTK